MSSTLLLAGQHRRQQDAVVVAVRLGAEHGDVVEVRRELEQFLDRAHAGHAVADHDQTRTGRRAGRCASEVCPAYSCLMRDPHLAALDAHRIGADRMLGLLEALAGAQIEVMLVDRRGDHDALAEVADQPAREHRRLRTRIEVVDGVRRCRHRARRETPRPARR